ncbi:MAG TPA: dodecin domain-containing protein [Nitrososphaeraceae archaeon]|jgi:flavin-binding protein dodecin|nr:dodecin domain-containing protein [Nitrososphaeraceae archaeon]
MTHHVAKVIEIIGSSQNGWEEAGSQEELQARSNTQHVGTA